MSENFFEALPSLVHKQQIPDISHYRDLPEDWTLFLTDVKGSTAAIERGKYKEVNMMGAAGIIAVQNALGSLAFPYIFGGDGATMAVPPKAVAPASAALRFTRRSALDSFGMQLRVAMIPAEKIKEAGGILKVSKLRASEKQNLALLGGTGWSMAESWAKSRESEFDLSEGHNEEGSLQGLECRWNPVPSQKGEMMALIVVAESEGKNSAAIYARVLSEVLKPDMKPVTLASLPIEWPPTHLLQEMRLKIPSRIRRWWSLLLTYAKTLFFYGILFLMGRRRLLEQPIAYLHELTENTDYLKFDDCLRMVIDVSHEQKAKILGLLESLHRTGDVVYGYYCHSHALMTCFVQGEGRHVHFIDAAGGGYAMAAKQLKAQKNLR